jgi:hypothetical protein
MKHGWPTSYVDAANEQVQTSDAKYKLLLHEQTQRSEMVISELRQALTAITAQDVANTRAAAAMKVQLRKELLEARHRVAELEPAWEMFIAQHNEDEEAQDLEQRRRAVERRWGRNLPSDDIDDSTRRQIASSYGR